MYQSELDSIIIKIGPQVVAELANKIDQLATAEFPIYGNPGLGLCFHIGPLSKKTPGIVYFPSYRLVEHYAEDWPWFSGDVDFPVPHEGMSVRDAYGLDNLWDDTTQYGHLRREFARYVGARLLTDCKRLHTYVNAT